MRTVADTAKQITALISKLSLKSPRPVSAKSRELVDIQALVEEVVAPIAEAGSVPIRVDGGPVGFVLGIREQLHQVLLNTVLNAQQAIGKDGSISIIVKQVGSSIRIEVEDTGVGIPQDKLETLFRPSPSRQVTGLGIGLYQTKQIIEAHDGTIHVRSEQGTGTHVHIELPLHCPPEVNTEKVMAASTAS